MADQLQRSDRTDPNRYQSLKETANENEKTRSPGWTDRGDMPAQQAAANEYDKAAQEKQREQHASSKEQSAGKELTDKQRAYLDNMVQKLGPSQPDKGQDRSREMERSRGMDLSR
jgi:hypothetical protein